MILLVITLCFTTLTLAEKYYVKPTLGASCPQEGVPCMTLSQYVAKPSSYFASNTSLIMLPGNHSLNNATLSIANITSLEIVNMSSSQLTTTINCTSSAMFNLERIQYTLIRGLTITKCGGNIVSAAEQFTMEDCNILGQNSGTGIFFENVVNGTIETSEFASNNGNGLPFGLDHGGGALIVINSNISILNSVFHDNQMPGGSRGGAIFSLNSSIFTYNVNFTRNIAQLGGAMAIQGGSVARIDNGLFHENAALQAGGVVFISEGSVLMFRNNIFETNVAGIPNVISGDGGVVFSNVGNNIIKEEKSIHIDNACTGIGSTYALQSGTRFESENSAYLQNIGYLFAGNTSVVTMNGNEITNNDYNTHGVFICYVCNITFNNSDFNNNHVTSPLNTHNPVILIAFNSTAIIDNCFFTNNSALIGGAINVMLDSHATVLNSKFDNNRAFDGSIGSNSVGAGAVTVATGSSFIAMNCTFSNNVGGLGGAIDVQMGSKVVTQNSTFYNNTALIAGGAIFCGGPPSATISVTDTTFVYNSALSGGVIATSTFCDIESNGLLNMTRNTGDRLGIVYAIQSQVNFTGSTLIAYNKGSIMAIASTLEISGDLTSINNTDNKNILSKNYDQGGAFTVFQTSMTLNAGNINLVHNAAENGGGLLIKESQLYVKSSSNLTVANNYANFTGGGMHVFQSELSFEGNVLITDNMAHNKGGGIHAIGASVVVTGKANSLQFVQNDAEQGGGIYLEQNSKIYVNKIGIESIVCNATRFPPPDVCYTPDQWLRVEFTSNTANEGGAVYIYDANTGICASTTEHQYEDNASGECFIQTLALYMANINASDRDVVNLRNAYFRNNTAKENGAALYGGLLDRCLIGLFGEQLLLQSTPDYHPPTYIFNVTDIKIDNIASQSTRVCFCKDKKPDCSYQHPPVYAQKGHHFTISAATVDQVNHTVPSVIHSSLASQLGGFSENQASQNTTSEGCTDLEYNVFSPNETDHVYLYAEGPCKNSGISRSLFEVKFLECTCPKGFQPSDTKSNCDCQCDQDLSAYVTNCSYDRDSIVRHGDFWITYINDTKEGDGYVVYSHCPYDYCTPATKSVYVNLNVANGADKQCQFNRTGRLCGACAENMSVIFGSSKCKVCSNDWLALLIVFAVAGVVLVTFILVFSFTVDKGTINGLIFYANIVAANHSLFLPFDTPNVLTVFISWINLDLGFETCFYDGMDGYTKTWLQFSFPFYVIFLVVAIIVICDYSDRFARLLIGKNPVATLATLILLSYTKLLRTIITALSFGQMPYPDDSQEAVWLFDANVPYISGKHIPLFIVALLVLLIGIVYTLVLFLWQWLQIIRDRYKEYRFSYFLSWLNNGKVNAFIDVYHAPYNPNHRYWTGLLLLCRVLLYLISAVNVIGDPRINLVSINTVIVCLFLLQHVVEYVLHGRIYKTWLPDVLESIFFINLIILASATFYITEADKGQAALAYVSTIVSFAMFLMILAYHTYAFTSTKRLLNYVITRCTSRPDRRPYNDIPELPRESSHVPPTEIVVDCPNLSQASIHSIQNGEHAQLLSSNSTDSN